MGNKISKKEKARREAEAKQKAEKKDRRSFIFMCVAMLFAMWLVGYLINGMELKSLPQEKAVASIEIQDHRLTEEVKVLTDEESIKNACSAVDILRVKYNAAEMTEAPEFTVVFQLEDGSSQQLQVNETTLLWNGEAHPVKQRHYKMFRDVVESIFFSEYLSAEQAADET